MYPYSHIHVYIDKANYFKTFCCFISISTALKLINSTAPLGSFRICLGSLDKKQPNIQALKKQREATEGTTVGIQGPESKRGRGKTVAEQ